MMRRRGNTGPLELVPCVLCLGSKRHGGACRAVTNAGRTAFLWGNAGVMADILRDADALADSRGMVAIDAERGDVGIYLWLELPERAVAIRYWPSVQREALDAELAEEATRPGLRVGSIIEIERTGLVSLHSLDNPLSLPAGSQVKIVRRDPHCDAYVCRIQRSPDARLTGHTFYLDGEMATARRFRVVEQPPWEPARPSLVGIESGVALREYRDQRTQRFAARQGTGSGIGSTTATWVSKLEWFER